MTDAAEPNALSLFILEQAMKYGRVLVFKAADAMVTAPAGVAAPQILQMELRPGDGKGGGQTWVLPTHNRYGKLLDDEMMVGFLKQMAEKLSEGQKD